MASQQLLQKYAEVIARNEKIKKTTVFQFNHAQHSVKTKTYSSARSKPFHILQFKCNQMLNINWNNWLVGVAVEMREMWFPLKIECLPKISTTTFGGFEEEYIAVLVCKMYFVYL